MRLILMALALVGCGPREEVVIDARSKYDQRLRPYVAMFFADAFSRGIFLSDAALEYRIKKQPLEEEMPNAVGICYRSKSGAYQKIVIGEEYWERAGEFERLAIMYHELGHCVMGIGHVPAHPSLMYPRVYGEEYLKVWFEKMADDLFENQGVPRLGGVK